jgi:hypothetical protein
MSQQRPTTSRPVFRLSWRVKKTASAAVLGVSLSALWSPADGSMAWQDGAVGSFSGELRVYLNRLDVSGPGEETEGLAMVLGARGARHLAWSDGQSVFYATVPH